VRSRSIFGTIGASLQTLVGGNITLLTNLCEKTRGEAFDLMLQHAGELGAMRCLARATTRLKSCRASLRCSLTVLRSWSNASLRHMLRVVPQTLSCLMLAKAAERQLSPAFNLTFHGKNHDFCGASTEPKEAAMKRFVSTFVMAVLLVATGASAQQSSPESNPDRRSGVSSAQSSPGQVPTSPNAQQQSNPQGGSPESPLPGRITGATPEQVQQALDRQLPANAQVTASVVDDGSLKLTGTVRSEADRSKAEQIAKESTNKRVDNQIQVKSGSTWDEKPKK